MKLKAIATAGIAAGLILGPVERAQADAGDAIAGALIGGMIGHAIAKDQQKRKSSTSRSSKTPSMSSAQREQNREIQTALNYFGYGVGSPDGVLGRKSRSAITEYQLMLGYPATGEITEHERIILVTSYHRAVAGGPMVAQTVASHPMGMRGLLLAQRDEMAGISQQQAVAPMQPAPAPMPTLMPAAPAAPVEAAAPAMPNFMGSGATQVSLASHCNKISLLTNSNGGYVTSATMTDAAFALGEQFCLARTYAMASGEDLAAKVAGFTPQQVSEQCAAFGPILSEHVASLSLKPRDEVLKAVQGFVLTSGMSPAQLSGTAKICLGVGYTTDAMDVAIGSALLLTAMGEGAYGELLGHHLTQGFGATVRPDLALDWYQLGIDAMGAGSAIFAPGLNGRPDLIRKAAFTMAGRAGELAPVVPAALPQFALAPEAAAPAAPVAAAPEAAVVVAPAVTAEAAPQPIAPQTQVSQVSAASPVPSPEGARVVLSVAKLPFLMFGQ